MAGLSSNVMNMKFMQRALDKRKEKQKEDELKKVKDASEWLLPQKSSLQMNLKTAPKVKAVGYGSIAALTSSNNEQSTSDEVVEKVCLTKPMKLHLLTVTERSTGGRSTKGGSTKG